MSNVKIQGNVSGTGSLTIAAPNTNSDRTLTLPDESGTLLTDSGAISVSASAPDNSVVINASGNLGIGTSSPGNKLVTASNATNSKIEIQNTSTAASTSKTSALQFTGTDTVGTLKETGDIYVTPADNDYVGSNMLFYTRGSDALTERARIDSSGNLLVGTTSYYFSIASRATIASTANQDKLVIANYGDNFGFGISFCPAVNSATPARFFNAGGGQVGSIATSASATTYNTSSDYRLKHDIQPMTGALARVAALKPVTYKWNVDGSDGEGFIAHELAEVCPGAVSGEKDAVNEDGSIKPQGIDTSFLAGLYAAAIQELKAELDTVKAELAAMKGTV